MIFPPTAASGFKTPRAKTDILIVGDESLEEGVAGEKLSQSFLVHTPGEYEVKSVFIRGIQITPEDKKSRPATLFVVEMESMVIVHLGGLSTKSLPDAIVEEIGDVDILFVPVGGGDALGPDEAETVVSQIEPRIVIPMNYKVSGSRGSLEGVQKFLKALGQESVKPIPKYVVKKKDLPQEETKVVVFEVL